MKNILVPVDFTLNSFAAYRYALQFANECQAEVTLLHVISGSFSPNSLIAFEPMKQLEEAMKERLRYFAFEYPEEEGIILPNVETHIDVRYGVAGFTIADFAEKNKMDAMVIGTKDQHGILDKLMGTTVSVLINISKVPMILINERTVYVRPSKLVFGFDGKMDLDHGIRYLKSFNRKFGASVDFVHVKNGKASQINESMAELVDIMTEDIDVYYPFTVKEIKSKSVNLALIDYCFTVKADLLVIYRRNTGFLERIFKRSHSLKISQELHLPVLIIPEAGSSD